MADASVVVKWLIDLDEADVAAAPRVLDALLDDAADVLALDLAFYEVGNALCRRLESASEAIA